MYFVLRKHLIYKDSYFLYATFCTKEKMKEHLRSFQNLKNIMIVEGGCYTLEHDSHFKEKPIDIDNPNLNFI